MDLCEKEVDVNEYIRIFPFIFSQNMSFTKTRKSGKCLEKGSVKYISNLSGWIFELRFPPKLAVFVACCGILG